MKLISALLLMMTTFAMAAEERASMKYDLGLENPKWKFAAGLWVRRASGGRQVLAQTVETQPWAVAVLEDQKFGDVDVSDRFRGRRTPAAASSFGHGTAATIIWSVRTPSRTTFGSIRS